jgi:hypothetical protein
VKNRYTLIIIGLGVVAYYFLRQAESSHSIAFMVLGLVLFGGALIASTFDHPKITAAERKQRFDELLDIHRPEETKQKVFELLLWLVYIFAPLSLLLRILPVYPLLDERLYLGLLYAVPAFFSATYLIPMFSELRRFPLVINIVGRVGLCIPAVALVFSLLLLLDCGGDRSSETRTAICLGKRASRGAHTNYYIRIKPWSDSDKEVEVDVPERVFSDTPKGTQLQITTGKGNLGIEWIRRVETLGRTSELPTRDFR